MLNYDPRSLDIRDDDLAISWVGGGLSSSAMLVKPYGRQKPSPIIRSRQAGFQPELISGLCASG
jgi:hypothetical protein